jgi:hypothetical protein
MKQKETIVSWNDETKLAAIYHLYLALDKTPQEDWNRRLEELFDIRQNLGWYLGVMGLLEPGETLPEDSKALAAERLKRPDTFENYCLAFNDFSKVKNAVTDFTESVIHDSGDDRYEQLVETIDFLVADNPCCITTYAARKCLWIFVMFPVSTDTFTENKKKFLRHFTRAVELDKSLIAEMETLAKSFVELGKKRAVMKVSNESYAVVVTALAAFTAEEQTLHTAVSGKLGQVDNEADFDEDDETDEVEDESFFDKAGNAVVDIIEGVSDGVVSVIDGFTGAFIDLL